MTILPNPFKKRNWVLVGTSTTDPQPMDLEKISPEFPKALLEKMVLGTTTYIWEDKLSGDIKKKEVLGVEETPLRQVLSRADTYGRFDLIDGDKKYAVVRLQGSSVIPQVVSQESQPITPIVTEETDIRSLPVRK